MRPQQKQKINYVANFREKVAKSEIMKAEHMAELSKHVHSGA